MVSVFANEFKDDGGNILAIGAQFVVRDPKRPIYATFFKFHQKVGKNNSHTRQEIDKLLKEMLPIVAQKYPNAVLLLIRDANAVNRIKQNFTRYDGFENFYCFQHLLINRVFSIVSCASCPVKYHFETSRGASLSLRIDAITKVPTLLTAPLARLSTMRILVEMSCAQDDDPQWTCLKPEDGDSEDFKKYKRVLLVHAEVFKLMRYATIGAVKTKIENYKKIMKDFIYVCDSSQYTSFCWSSECNGFFQALLRMDDRWPIQCFTLCCDEYFTRALKGLVGKEITIATGGKNVGLKGVKDLIKLICNQPLTNVSSSFGHFHNKVKFFYHD